VQADKKIRVSGFVPAPAHNTQALGSSRTQGLLCLKASPDLGRIFRTTVYQYIKAALGGGVASEHTMNLAEQINVQLVFLRLLPLNSEQLDCLNDPARLDEAAGMLNDLAVRCGVRLPFPAGTELGPFASEEEAREEAQEQAQRFDAVCIDKMATDEGRSYGRNEYYVTGFNGPNAALAAACRADAGYWVAGKEHFVD
jgi:hypothetical protein